MIRAFAAAIGDLLDLARPVVGLDAGQQRLFVLRVRRPITRTAYSRSTS
jgi:hypothetical protein